MKRYVIGFMFDQTKQNVALIKKNRPEWQAGTLNGIGGKIEKGESPVQAMVREFQEETGVQTMTDTWAEVLVLKFPYAEVHIFTASSDYYFFAASTSTDEEIMKRRTQHCLRPQGLHSDVILVENVPELIELSLQRLSDQVGVAPKTWSESL